MTEETSVILTAAALTAFVLAGSALLVFSPSCVDGPATPPLLRPHQMIMIKFLLN